MSSNKKQSMSEIKLRRLTELNTRLREDLDRPRIKVSEACESLIAYTKTSKDYMVPSVWGQIDKKEDRISTIICILTIAYVSQSTTNAGICGCF